MTSRKIDRRGFISLLGGMAALGGGSVLLSKSLEAEPDNIPPDIDEPVIAVKGQKKTGAETIKHEKKVITLENMDSSMLLIPSLNVYAPIDTSGNFGKVNEAGLIIPSEEKVTRWVKGADVSSSKGNILLAGHVSFNGTPGALYNLAKLKAGSVAMVSDGAGRKQEFQLDSMVSYKKQSLPTEVWSPNGGKKLIVVTCGGKLNKLSNGTWHFDSNIVSTWHPISKIIK